MSAAHAGARRVGWLEDLAPVERLAVRCLRDWQRAPERHANLTAELAVGLGPKRGRSTEAVLAELMEIGALYSRRPLCRHACTCACLGADEAVFAMLVSCAANGEQEDAAMLSALLVRPDMASCFAGLAAEFGIALSAMAREGILRQPMNTAQPNALH